MDFKVLRVYNLGSTKEELYLKSSLLYLVQMRLSAASEKCVASSGSIFLDFSELLSFLNFPSDSMTLVLFIEIRVYLHFLALKITFGKRESDSFKMLIHNKYLSCSDL